MAALPHGPGLFSASLAGRWEWRGTTLVDALGHQIAAVRSDILVVGEERVLLEYSGPGHRFRMRATTGLGEVTTVRQEGWGNRKLVADCNGRSYTLLASREPRRREIFSPAGLVAVVRPRGQERVEIVDSPGYTTTAPLMDEVLLSWACVLVDAASNHRKHSTRAW